jgi:preprotein translocase subunit SecD
MKLKAVYFNIILLSLVLAAGCQTTNDSKKERSSIRLHIEVNQDGTTFSRAVPIYRAQPVLVNVESSPFADERDVERAEVIDLMGGFAIQLQFGRHGQWMLENVTRSNPNHRVAVFSDFREDSRWLGAPLITRPIADGVFTFTPDATREEAGRLVRGLNNFAAEVKKKSKF